MFSPQARRWFLKDCAVGLGSVALGQLLQQHSSASAAGTTQKTHHAPRAKNVICLFMAGAPSHLELFDNKPQLAKYDGKLPPEELIRDYRAAFISPNSVLLGPKFKFSRHGESGQEMSEILPHMTKVADDIAIVKSMVTDAFNHAPGQLQMSTGSQQFGKPGRSTGSAVSHRTCQVLSCSAPAGKVPAAAVRTGAAGSCRRFTRECSSAIPETRCSIFRTRRALMMHCSGGHSTH